MNESLPLAERHFQDSRFAWPTALAFSLLATLALLIPFFWLGSASGHDFEFHVASWLDVAYQWRHGVLFPRWTFWTNYGFGEPRYIFYPPLSWILGAALTVIAPISWVPAAFILLTQTFAGAAAYALLRRLTTPRGACFGAAFYAINPYAILLSYVRSDFAEQLACAIFPLLLLAALRLAGLLDGEHPGLPSIPSFAIPFAAVWLCNAPAGVMASYSMTLLFAVAAVSKRSWKIFLRSTAALALGFGLSTFYLLPAAYEERWVNIGQALSSGLLPFQNFLFTNIDDVEHTWFNWVSSIAAVVLILFAALATLASRKFARETSASPSAKRTWRILLLLGVACTVLMLRPTVFLWNILPQLRYIQFPWRWMSFLAVICCCFLAAVVERRRGWLAFVLVVALSIPLAVFLGENTWWDPDEMPTQQAAVVSGKGFEGVDEYDPLGDDHLDLASQAPLAVALAAHANPASRAQPLPAKIDVKLWLPEKKELVVDSPEPARVALRLLDYPAWRVTVNGRGVTPVRTRGVDQMFVPISAGISEIEIRFVRTPDRSAGIAVSVLCCLLGIGLLGSRKRMAS